MHIALNATPLLSPLSGVGQYVYQLASAFKKMSDIELDLFYASYWSQSIRTQSVTGIVTLKSLFKKFIPNAYRVNRFIQQRRFSSGSRNCQADIYHEPNFLAFQFDGPSVITVHDLTWIRYPETHPVERVRAMNRYFERGLQNAASILVDSAFVRHELIDLFNLPSEKVNTVPLGITAGFYPRSEAVVRSVLSRHNLKYGQYLLLVGTLEPRKNIQLALDAWIRLPQKLRSQHPLVMAGMKGWHTTALEKKIAPFVKSGGIIPLGYVPQNELPLIVSGAQALIYPSLYEGFGLPPLEAMASGVPVIASNVSSLPEVIGEAGILINPHDVEKLSEAIERVIVDSSLRSEMIQKGMIQSATFSWEKCALQTLAVYQSVIKM